MYRLTLQIYKIDSTAILIITHNIMTATTVKNAIINLTIEDLDTFPSFLDMLKSKKKDLLSEKATLNKAAKEAIATAEKKKKRDEAIQRKKDDARLDTILSKLETGAKNAHKQMLKEFSFLHVSGGSQETERKWNKGSYARFCKYFTPEKLEMTDKAIKDAGGKKKWNSEQWRLLSKDIQNSSDSAWNIHVETHC